MNMPAFTAESSLYKTRGHYRTGPHSIDSSAQTVSPIRPAAREQEGEIINVHGCPPGSIAVGEQPNITCVFIPPGGAGGGDGGIPPGGGPEDGGPDDGEPYGTKKPPPKGSQGCSTSVKERDPFAQKCTNKNRSGKGNNWDVFCGPGTGEMWCCNYSLKKGYFDCEHKAGIIEKSPYE